MKLVFYSGGTEEENLLLDQHFIKLINKKDPVITFIPSSSYDSEIEFKEFVNHYSKFKIYRFIHFPVDHPFDTILLNEVLKSDVIHLAGGNTFYFLNSLRKSKFLPELKKFVARGGILTGLSAGAIIMTENIELAGYPEFDRDENEINLKNLSSLNLVDFFFFPHFKNSKRYNDVFKAFSKKSKKTIYACPDGAGILVDTDGLNGFNVVGKCYAFRSGHKMTIKS